MAFGEGSVMAAHLRIGEIFNAGWFTRMTDAGPCLDRENHNPEIPSRRKAADASTETRSARRIEKMSRISNLTPMGYSRVHSAHRSIHRGQ
jgi:hypothetical protein